MKASIEHQQLARQLDSGLSQLKISHEPRQVESLLQYVALLQRWNRRMNLIGSVDDETLITRHILDCAAPVPWLSGQTVADIGSGAGLPGLVLAILSPDRHYSLIDSREKRTQFLRHAVHHLGLESVDVVCSRVEQYPLSRKFDTLISRAFSRLDLFVASSRNLSASDGRWLAMKGRVHQDELTDLKNLDLDTEQRWHVEVQPLAVPSLDEERHLVIVQRSL